MRKDWFGEKEGRGMRGWRGGHHAHFPGGEFGGGLGGKHLLHGHFGHRIFDHGDLRFVILKLIAVRPSYGYELIKAVEDRVGGGYSPSPGIVYPTLTMLEEIGLATVKADASDRKLYSITPQGQKLLQESKGIVDAIFARMESAASVRRREKAPQILRALENLKLAIRLKFSQGALSEEQIRTIADAIDSTARKIEER